MAKLSLEEIERLKLAGASKRAQRLEKKRIQLEQKEQLVQKDDSDYRLLSRRLRLAEKHLTDVIQGKELLNPKKVTEILDLLTIQNFDDVTSYNHCRDEYRDLVCRCCYFGRGEAGVLRQKAFEVWKKMLFHPKVEATGWIVFNILHAGHICNELYQVLQVHREKYMQSGIGPFIAKSCRQLLKGGGVLNEKNRTISPWKEAEVNILKNIIALFEKDSA